MHTAPEPHVDDADPAVTLADRLSAASALVAWLRHRGEGPRAGRLVATATAATGVTLVHPGWRYFRAIRP